MVVGLWLVLVFLVVQSVWGQECRNLDSANDLWCSNLNGDWRLIKQGIARNPNLKRLLVYSSRFTVIPRGTFDALTRLETLSVLLFLES